MRLNAFFFSLYLWLCWVFTAAWAFLWLWRAGLSSSCGASHCGGFPCCRVWALRRKGFGSVACGLSSWGSWAPRHRLSCSAGCGIFPDQGLNSCLLHWQADSLPLSQQRSSWTVLSIQFFFKQLNKTLQQQQNKWISTRLGLSLFENTWKHMTWK